MHIKNNGIANFIIWENPNNLGSTSILVGNIGGYYAGLFETIISATLPLIIDAYSACYADWHHHTIWLFNYNHFHYYFILVLFNFDKDIKKYKKITKLVKYRLSLYNNF